MPWSERGGHGGAENAWAAVVGTDRLMKDSSGFSCAPNCVTAVIEAHVHNRCLPSKLTFQVPSKCIGGVVYISGDLRSGSKSLNACTVARLTRD